ncbi:hypothetical protein GGU10DRAFT_330120 [Lentinula aff. detonsa]|uniref:MFS general substrate transporter n=1 Tax=Lentinula aff. detonsa TaxID=2804958 RepID=A0AA38TY79_9AGAR|nr:hypothetical protein GGU10DRAFT_330120 [Lentinula aff. detonsa]
MHAQVFVNFNTGSMGSIVIMVQFAQSRFDLSPTLQGVVVALSRASTLDSTIDLQTRMILVTSTTSGIFPGFLVDRISRVVTMALGAAIFCAGLIVKCVAGVGEGFHSEFQSLPYPENSIIQIAVTVGIADGFFCCYETVHLESFAWRIPFFIQAVLYSSLQPAMDEEYNDQSSRSGKYLGTFGDHVHRRKIAGIRDTLLACFLMGCCRTCTNQLPSIDGIIYYAPVLFSQAVLSAPTSKSMACGVSVLLNDVLITICIAGIYVSGADSGRSSMDSTTTGRAYRIQYLNTILTPSSNLLAIHDRGIGLQYKANNFMDTSKIAHQIYLLGMGLKHDEEGRRVICIATDE